MENDSRDLEKGTNQKGFLKRWGLAGLVAGGLLTTGAMGLEGCGSSTPRFYASAVGSGNPRDSFMQNEAITLILSQYAGKSCNLYIRDASTGNIVKRESMYIPQDWYSVEFTMGNLPAGSYRSVAEVEGNTVGAWNFLVR